MKHSTQFNLPGKIPSCKSTNTATQSNKAVDRFPLVAKAFLVLLLSCISGVSFATAWRTNATGAIGTPGNWRDVATGAVTPTVFTTPGDTWQIQNAMTLSGTWTVGTSGGAASTVSMIGGGGLTVSATSTINIFGGVNFSSGTIAATGFSANLSVNIYGNASFSGTFKMTNSNRTNTVNMSLPTASGTMFIDNTSTGTWTSTDFNVISGSTAQLDGNFSWTGFSNGTFTLSGTLIVPSAFTVSGNDALSVNSGATLKIANSGGISSAIISTSNSFSGSANYVFNGTTAQVTGTGLPTITGGGSVTVSNAAGVSLSSSLNLSSSTSTLNLTSGNLAIGGHTLTIGGILTGNSAANVITGSTTSNITISGSGAIGTLYFDQSTPGTSNGFSIFTMSRSGITATLGNSISVGTLALSSGSATIADGGNLISVSGNITGTGSCTGTGGVAMSGSAATISGVTLGNLTLNNAAGFSLSGSPTITGILTLSNGTLTTGGNSITVPGAAGSVAGASASNYIIGTLRKTITGLTSVNYEVGDVSGYAPMLLTFGSAGTAGNLGVKVTSGTHPQVGTSLIQPTHLANHYWTITNIGAAGVVTVTPTATYNAGDILGGSNTLFTTQEYASSAWLSAPLASTNTSSPFTTTPTTGIALATAAGDYIFGNQDLPCVAPADAASGTIAFPTITSTGGSVSFTNATSSPTGYIVVASTGSLSGTPAAGTSPTTGTSCCTNGTIIGTGTTSPIAISSTLTNNTSYTISIFDYNNTSCTGGPVYNLTTPAATTLLTCPGVSTALTNGTITSSSIATSWTAPANGAASYTVSVYTNAGLTIPATGYSVAYAGTSATISGLSPLTQYWYNVTGNNTSCNSAVSVSQTATTLNTACAGTPSGGAAVTSAASVTPGSSFTVSLTGASITLGLNYQWLSSICGDSASFTNIPGATNATFSATETEGTFYRCNVICSNSGLSALSLPAFVGFESVLGCSSYGGLYTSNGCSFNVYLNAFSLTGDCGTTMSDASIPCSSSSYYTDHTSLTPVKMFPGGTYSGTMNKPTGTSVFGSVYIDFNDNGSFDDAGENVFNSTAAIARTPGNTTFSITVPADAPYGTHRMRVRSNFSAVTSSCGSLTAGDVVDYFIQIVPNLTVSYNSPICGTGSLILTSLPSLTCGAVYTWSGPGSYNKTTYNSNSVSLPAAAGVYSVSVSINGAASCSSAATTNVIVNSLPTLTAVAAPGALCAGSTLALNATPAGGGGTYPTFTWSGPGGFSASAQNTTNPSITAAGTGIYSVSVTDNNGCSASATTASVTVNSLPSITATALPLAACAGSTLTLNATPAGGSGTYPTYSWNGPGGFTSTVQNATSAAITTAGAGIYSVSVTDDNGCSSASAVTSAVTINPQPTIIASVSPTVLCAGGTLTLNATPAGGSTPYASFSWSGPGGFSASSLSAANAGITTGGAGIYSVTVTDNNGCTSLAGTTTAVAVNALPAIAATATPNPICVSNTLSLNATPTGGSGTYTSFSWSGPSTYSSASQSNTIGSVTSAAAGVYSVSVTDDNGCTSLTGTTLNVVVNALPTVTANATPNPVCTGATLTLNATPAGGSGIYPSYTWNGPGGFTATTQNPVNSSIDASGAGVYSVSVTDNKGCTSATLGTTAAVTEIPSPTVVAAASPLALCAATTLTLNATPSGGSGAYTGYSWSGPGSYSATTQSATNPGITAAGAGVYSVTVTDANGCTGTATTTAVSVNPLPVITATATPTPLCANTTLTLNATPSGGSGTYSSFSWSGPASFTAGTQNTTVTGITAAGAGVYHVSVTDNNGCTSASTGNTASVVVNPLPVITATATPTGICLGNTLNLNSTPTGGSGTYTTFTWSGPAGFTATTQNTSRAAIGISDGGVYSVTVTDNNGCVAASTGVTAPVVVTPLPSVAGFGLPSVTSVCVGFAPTATAIAPVLTDGTYTVTYDLSGVNTVTGHTTSMTVTAGIGTFSVPASDILSAGSTTVTVTLVTNANGCNSSLSSGNSHAFTVNALPAAITGTTSVCLLTSATLNDATTPGTWSSSDNALATVGSGSGVVTGVSAGVPTITYTIASGCYSTVPLFVNPIPSVYAVTGGGTFCSSNPTVHVGLANSDFGANYQVYVGGIATGGLVTGTGSPLDLGVQTTPGTYTVVANPSAVCAAAMGGSVSVSSLPSPTIYSVTGGGSYCSGGSGVPVGLSHSQTGVSYQLYNGISPVGSLVPGTGLTLPFGSETAAGTYTVTAKNLANLCLDTMSLSAIVNINPLPAAITGTAFVCAGQTTPLADGTTGGTWSSSSTSSATVGSSTGIVTGVTAGTPSITYTLPTGCNVAQQVTINPIPSAIAGPSTVCAGSSISLTNGITGGTWISGTVSVATIGLSSGTVNSLTAGTTSITYTLPAGCATNSVVIVNPQPGANTGASAICIGSPSTLNNATTGGVWSSSALSVASVGSLSGVVTGASTGVSSIAYTLPGGCFAATSVTVNTPGTISGPSTVCISAAISLTSSVTGGTWSSSNTSVATVGSASGIVTGASSNTATINYMTPAGCQSSYLITVNALPATNNVTGGGGYCVGGVGVHIGLNGSISGLNYRLFNGSTGSGGVLAGTGLPLDFGSRTAAGTYTVVATNPVTGCTATMAGSAAVVINPLPTVFTISGSGSYCAGGAGIDVSMSGSTAGISYQLFDASTPMGGARLGTGVPVDFGFQTAGGTYGVLATDPVTGCTSNSSGSAVVTVLPLPTAYSVVGGGSFCAGGAGVHVFLSSSTIGTTYQLFNTSVPSGTAVAGTGAALDFGPLTAPGVYTATANNTATGCSGPMPGSATITVNPSPTLNIVTGGGGYCSGSTSTVVVGLDGSVSGLSYQLKLGIASVGSPVAGTGSPVSFGAQSLPGVYTVVATNPLTGCTATMTGSATVFINPLPSVFTVTGGGNYCTGPASVHVGLNGSTAGVNYQLLNAGVATGTPVAGTGVSLDFGALPAGSYTVRATSSTGCTINMSGSASITVNPLPTAFSVTGGGSYCSGAAAPHIFLSGSVSGTTYTLSRAGSAVSALSGSGSSLDFGSMPTAGTYTVSATTTSTGCTGSMTGSASISINPLPISTFSVTGGGSYCAGGAGKVVGMSGSTSGISYQLFVGGISTGSAVTGTGLAFNFPSQTTVGSYTVVATNTGTTCSSNMTSSVSISTIPVPVVYNVTGGGGYCAGTTAGVHIGLAGSNVGISYQLFLGGTVAVGAAVTGTGSALDFGAQTVIGTYTIVATNISTLCTSNMFGNAVVSIIPLPASYSVSAGGSYCLGGSGYPVSLGNSDAGVSYQLLRGGATVGAPVGGSGSALNFGNQTITGTYTVRATNATGCISNMAGAATITTTPLPAVFNVTSSNSTYCADGTGVTIGLSGSATGFSYQLYNAGVATGIPVTGTGSALSFGLNTTGVYTAVSTDGTTSCTNNMSGTLVISTTPLPTAYTVSGGGNYCAGGTGLDVSLSNSDAGFSYQLYKDAVATGSPLAGTGTALHFGLQTATGTYTISATNFITGCTQNMTGSVTIGINSLPSLHSVTGGGNYCSGGTGVDIALDGGSAGVSYQLYRGSSPVGVALTGTSIDFGTQTAAGSYTVVATAVPSGCTLIMNDTLSVGISPLPNVYSVTGGGNYCPSGSGVHVGLNGSDLGVNYQLYLGVVATGPVKTGTGSSLDFGLQTGTGIYTVLAINPATSCTNNMSGSATVMVSSLAAAYNVTGGGNYCAGAGGLNVGLDGSAAGTTYQLYLGTTPTGPAFVGTGFPLDFGAQTAAGTYTVLSTGSTSCSNTMGGSATISINPLPVASAVTGGGNYCAGTGGIAVGIALSEAGVGYQLYNGISPVGPATPGTGGSLSFGAQTDAGVYTVIGTNAGTGCSNGMTGSTTIGINPLPAALTVIGGGNYCPAGTGVHVGLNASITGISYQLYNDLVATGTAVAGTGLPIDFGLQTGAGTYTVVANNSTTSCTSNMTGSVAVGISSLPTTYAVSASANQYCAGGTGVSLLLSGSDAGTNYQLYLAGSAIDGPTSGTGIGLNFGLHTAPGTYTVIATNTTTGCVNNMTGSSMVSVNPLPDVYAVAGGGNYCIGGTGVHIGLAASHTGTSYQLYNGGLLAGSPVTGTASALDFGLQTATGVYTIIATNPLTGCVNTMSGGATVGLNSLPTVYTVTGGGNYCASGAGVNIGLTGSGATTSYQLFNGSSVVGAAVTGSGTLLGFGAQTLSGTYTVIATNTATGCTNPMAGSASISINSLPTAYTVTGGGNYCSGGTGVHVGLDNSLAGINYQLYNGASVLGVTTPGTGTPLDFGTQTLAGTYTIKATNTTTGCINTMSGSASIVINSLPTVYTVTGGGNYCAGGTGVPVGLSNSGSGIIYQLIAGITSTGLPVSGTGGSIDFGPQTTAGSYSVVATNPVTGCTTNMSGTPSVAVNPVVAPSMTLSTGVADTICAGTPVTITAIVANGGTTPTYSWTVNGVAVSAAGSAFTYAPSVGDVVGATLTSSAACASPASVNASAGLSVLSHAMPTIHISASSDTVCQGTSVTYTQVASFGGATPSVNWLVNGISQSSAATYAYIPHDGDIVYCVLNSSYQCRLATAVTSNNINMQVDVPVTPSLVVNAEPGASVPQGQPVVLIAAISNEVIAPTYQWYVNGVPVSGATGSSYTVTNFNDFDSVSCTVTSGGGCAGLKGSNAAVLHFSNVGVAPVTTTGSDIKLVPNPNKGIFTIKGTLGTTDDQEVSVEVSDMLGQIIYKDKIMAHGGALNQRVQLSNTVANGMYILSLHSVSANDVFHVVIEQ